MHYKRKKDMRTVKLENLRNGENFKPLTSDYDDYKSGYCTKLRTEGNNVYCVQVDGRDNCWDFIMRKDDKVIRNR